MKNSFKKKCMGTTMALLAVTSVAMPVMAEETPDVVEFSDIAEERSVTEQQHLLDTYRELFPNEYAAILNYQENGVTDVAADEVVVSVYKTAEKDGVEYELTVMSNGQVFMNYSEEVACEDAIMPLGAVYGTRYVKTFTVGELGYYNSFTIEYLINDTDFDEIMSCQDVTGSGFLLYPTNLSKKMKEDASGPAHYGYNNVKMDNGSTAPLYDIGVGVGNNKAKSITKVSSGADMWLWSFIYSFTNW